MATGDQLHPQLDDVLLTLAEAGLAVLNPLRIERVRQLALRVERLGLQGLAVGLGKLATAPARRPVCPLAAEPGQP